MDLKNKKLSGKKLDKDKLNEVSGGYIMQIYDDEIYVISDKNGEALGEYSTIAAAQKAAADKGYSIKKIKMKDRDTLYNDAHFSDFG